MQRFLFKRIQKPLQNLALCANYITTTIPTHNNTNATTIPHVETSDSWASIIFDLAQCGTRTGHALFEASHMLISGTKPNGYLFVQMVRASANLGWDFFSLQLHSYILRSGFCSNVFVSTALINFYIGIGSLSDAHQVFVEIPQPSVVSWNSLISGYVHSGQFCKALSLFLQLERSEVSVDSYSLTAALGACGQLSFLLLGKTVHSKTVKLGLENSTVVLNCLIDMYGKCGSLQEAILVFNNMIEKDTISWNSVIAASARNGSLQQAFSFLQQMHNPDIISYNELINGFSRFGDVEDAIKLLFSMPNPNSSSWNSIITGYVNRSRAREALDFFCKMHLENVEMDQFTFSSILSGVAGISALTWGMLIHCCTIKFGLATSIVVGSSLIDMYSKCGKISDAETIFHLLPEKNLVTWNSMISGFSWNGNPSKMMLLFEQMKMERDVKPDEITFLNVISACLHNQIPFENALQYFESMIKEYGIEPTLEHCCSMIRLMGQRGEVWRAENMIFQLGFGTCGSVWRALLGACGKCRDLKVAKNAAAKVIQLEGEDEFVYVTMSNLYAHYAKWEDVRVARKLMKEKGMRKEAGYSWIERENVISNSELQ
ncbi:putative tetratricopeptide-like helical domain-containing protein [Rosa chinensis]|uniref:Putative tetratricopeptide-like helical domain-containing protein n=1 Tax=Rosa chinensis TaxID=74649 RepID=A0A2P6P8G8_ROSCH|nr:putative pentatricopeptide repeat-containing protein At5g47460 [Rosa chinensis]PRQ18215.1 putative tetratricopeptide-like helical domain-containing protein [Rosa chinensis]